MAPRGAPPAERSAGEGAASVAGLHPRAPVHRAARPLRERTRLRPDPAASAGVAHLTPPLIPLQRKETIMGTPKLHQTAESLQEWLSTRVAVYVQKAPQD